MILGIKCFLNQIPMLTRKQDLVSMKNVLKSFESTFKRGDNCRIEL